jgi:hypothetical protein
MRIDRRLIGFGLFLVTVGVVMVAVRQGLVPAETASRAWNLWPLLLIGVGLSMILAGRPGAAIGGLMVALTLGTIVGGAAATGSIGICTGDPEAASASAPDEGGELGASARVTIEQACGDLEVATVAGSGWTVGSSGRRPIVSASASELRISSSTTGMLESGTSSTWSVILPQAPSIDLAVTASAGEARLLLAGANLAGLSVVRNAGTARIDLRDVAAIGPVTVTVNAGSATIWLPSRSLSGHLEANAASVALCLPTGAGLRIDIGDSVAASNDFGAHGMTRIGDAWETPGFAGAAAKIELAAEANAASLSLNSASACSG